MNRRRRAAVGLFVLLSVFFAALGVAVFLWHRNACMKEVLRTTEISGVRFVVERCNCDILAKDESISIYATKLPESPFAKLVGSFHRPTPLFRYDPDEEDGPPPTIDLVGQEQIRIAVSRVSSILVQNRKWNHLFITYDIGKLYYPISRGRNLDITG